MKRRRLSAFLLGALCTLFALQSGQSFVSSLGFGDSHDGYASYADEEAAILAELEGDPVFDLPPQCWDPSDDVLPKYRAQSPEWCD